MTIKLILLVSLTLSCVLAVQIIDSASQQSDSAFRQCPLTTGCKLDVSTDILTKEPETVKKIEQKFDISPDKGEQQGLREREKLQQQYRDKITGGSSHPKIKIPERPHQNGQLSHSQSKKRLLDSTNNQYAQIDQGNTYQATDKNYIYSLRAPNLTIHKITGTNLTQIYFQTFSYSFYPQQIHASNGYFALIFQTYNPKTVAIRVYGNDGSNITLVRSYQKQGTYVSSRQFNQNLIVVIQQQMKSPTLDYTWTLSDVGQVNQSVYDGISANKTANNIGYAVRSIARIPLASSSLTNYRFASYLFVDYTYDIMLSPSLNLYIAGNHYNASGYAVSIQKLSLIDTSQNWGTSKWIVLPGIILNSYQLHEYNKHLRMVVNYANGQLGTIGQVSIIKIPIHDNTLDPANGTTYINQGIHGMTFYASRWRKDIVDLIFTQKIIKSFSTSLGITVGTLITKQRIYYLYPYGNKNIIGFGQSEDTTNIALINLQISNYKLIYKQSITLNATFSYSSYGWYGTQFLQFDHGNKRITFPIYSSEDEPYKSGYYQIYANTQIGCMSTIPISCTGERDVVVPVYGHVYKHWDDSDGYDWATGSSEEIKRSSTIVSGGQQVLITGSGCQLQARKIKDPSQVPVKDPSKVTDGQFTYVDLCV